MSVPKLDVSQAKLDKLAGDLEKLEVTHHVKVGDTNPAIPVFQRQGYLEKLGHSRKKWFSRFFVLRDSFLLSYNLQKSDFTVEPRACVHLGNSKIQALSHGEKEFCFFITTLEKDQFLFAASSEEERHAWMKDLEVARTITHANMVKLAVENQCLAEEKGVAGLVRDKSVSALSLFSNSEYIKNTPLTGGAEGWLRTLGFNPDYSKQGATFWSRKSQLKKSYFILRDSHLLMFHGGDVLTKPRGVMYLVGSVTESLDEEEGLFRLVTRSDACGDFIEMVSSSDKQRQRWVQALKVASRVTYPDFKLLLKEHELFAAITMTPRAAPPARPNHPSVRIAAAPQPLLAENVDLQGQQLDPGAHQPYDETGNPLIRNPDGKLVNSDGVLVPPKTARYNAHNQQLDPFNRPLPPGAVPMFSPEGQPIGVGPDGQHYLADGTVVDKNEKHYDVDGNALELEIVQAASQIAADVNVAIKVRARLKADGAAEEAVDALGRTFRATHDAKSGLLVNADGEKVPLKSARKVESSTGQLVDYDPAKEAAAAAQSGSMKLTIVVDEEGDERELGDAEVTATTTLKELRHQINEEVSLDFPDFVFIIQQIAVALHEEGELLAHKYAPRVLIRGKELKVVEQPRPKFNNKLEALYVYETQKKKEKEEFEDIMAKIRQGKFLKHVKPTAGE